MLQVNKRGGFSDRNGMKQINTEIQVDNFDKRTRIQLFNLFNKVYDLLYKGNSWTNEIIQNFFKYVYDDIFCLTIDARKMIDDDEFFDNIQDFIMNASYDEILTFIEGISDYWEDKLHNLEYNSYDYDPTSYDIYNIFNNLFETEYVGYRFINKLISPITDEIELTAITESMQNENDVIKEHFEKAHRLLADRDCPDYENSIKESISGVEAMCEIITGARVGQATLGNMLKTLEDKGVVIHGALKSAFNILYGYTSDANGIRHAGDIGGEASTFEEAKFMLVSCCAFVNYLKGMLAD